MRTRLGLLMAIGLLAGPAAVAMAQAEPDAAAGTQPEFRAGRWAVGSAMGFLGSTPDGAAVSLNGSADYFVEENIAIGPLTQLAFADDMTLFGLSGQGKYYIDIPQTRGRGRVVLQTGIGFAHADFNRDDTSWLVPMGIGYDYDLGSGISLTMTGLVNLTNLDTGAGTGADVMPGFAFGVKF